MKKLSTLIFLLCLWQTSFSQNSFYRYENQIIMLQPDFSAFVIVDSNIIPTADKNLIISQLSRIPMIQFAQNISPNSLLVAVKPNTPYSFIQSIQQNLNVTYSTLQFSPVYTYKSTRWIYPTNLVTISLKPTTSISQINALFGNQYVSAIQNQYDNSYWFILKDIKDLFSLTESIYQSGLVEWAQPDFISAYLTNSSYNFDDPTNLNPCSNVSRLYNISPNPASEQIKIVVSEKTSLIDCLALNPKIKSIIDSQNGITFSEVNIYNSVGTLVLSKQMNKAEEFTLPLKELAAGLYLVQITEGEYTEKHKIIVE